MKIGVLTWWRNNYGSILQAYALQHELSKYEDVDYEIICQYGKSATSVDNVVDKLKSKGVIETGKRIFWKVAFKGLRQRNTKLQEFVNINLRISEANYNKNDIQKANNLYDAFICGSDQIWNASMNPVDSMYWLSFVDPGKKKIAYAPSMGINELTDSQKKQIKKNISDFTAVSCRESTGTKILNEIAGKEICKTVLDPTLMVEPEFWEDQCPPKMYDKRYLFVYLLRGTREQREIIEAFATERGLKIVTVPFLERKKIERYDLKFGDIKCWDPDPLEFVSLIRNAEYVFCDSFHCMVFSILNHKPYFLFPKVGTDGEIKKTQLIRLIDLQETLQIRNRIAETAEDIDELANDFIDWLRVDSILQNKREESVGFLRDALLS